MVKKAFWFVVYTGVFLLSLYLFFPKTALYYLGEKELKKFDVVISNERVVSQLFSLDLYDADLYVHAVKSAKFRHGKILLLGVYNTITIDEIMISKVLRRWVPLKVKSAHVTYSLASVGKVFFDAQGEFGSLHGSVLLDQNKIEIFVKPSKRMQTYRESLGMMKKHKNGEYSYVTSF